MMVRVAFEAGAVGPPHSHPHVQCSLVERGVFDITIAGRTERLGAGDSFLVPPDAVHDAKAIEAGVLLDVFTPMRADFV
jgi:quercetin dioxygenase-like cupin family protein